MINELISTFIGVVIGAVFGVVVYLVSKLADQLLAKLERERGVGQSTGTYLIRLKRNISRLTDVQAARYWGVASLFVIVTLASSLRLWELDQIPSMGGDEVASGFLTSLDVYRGFMQPHMILERREAPIEWYVRAFFFHIFGVSVFTARLETAFFGVLTVVAVYLLTSCIFNKRTALLASLLLAVNPIHVLFLSRVSRLNAPMLPLAIMAMYFFFRGVEEKHDKLILLAGIFAGFSFLVYATAGVLFPTFFLYLLVTRRLKLLKSKYILTGILLALFIYINIAPEKTLTLLDDLLHPWGFREAALHNQSIVQYVFIGPYKFILNRVVGGEQVYWIVDFPWQMKDHMVLLFSSLFVAGVMWSFFKRSSADIFILLLLSLTAFLTPIIAPGVDMHIGGDFILIVFVMLVARFIIDLILHISLISHIPINLRITTNAVLAIFVILLILQYPISIASFLDSSKLRGHVVEPTARIAQFFLRNASSTSVIVCEPVINGFGATSSAFLTEGKFAVFNLGNMINGTTEGIKNFIEAYQNRDRYFVFRPNSSYEKLFRRVYPNLEPYTITYKEETVCDIFRIEKIKVISPWEIHIIQYPEALYYTPSRSVRTMYNEFIGASLGQQKMSIALWNVFYVSIMNVSVDLHMTFFSDMGKRYDVPSIPPADSGPYYWNYTSQSFEKWWEMPLDWLEGQSGIVRNAFSGRFVWSGMFNWDEQIAQMSTTMVMKPDRPYVVVDFNVTIYDTLSNANPMPIQGSNISLVLNIEPQTFSDVTLYDNTALYLIHGMTSPSKCHAQKNFVTFYDDRSKTVSFVGFDESPIEVNASERKIIFKAFNVKPGEQVAWRLVFGALRVESSLDLNRNQMPDFLEDEPHSSYKTLWNTDDTVPKLVKEAFSLKELAEISQVADHRKHVD